VLPGLDSGAAAGNRSGSPGVVGTPAQRTTQQDPPMSLIAEHAADPTASDLKSTLKT
jgi:hypothetical protein